MDKLQEIKEHPMSRSVFASTDDMLKECMQHRIELIKLVEQKDKIVSELEGEIEKHNSACEETCDMWREQGQQCGYQEYIEQSEYMARKACAADCPREWVIKL